MKAHIFSIFSFIFLFTTGALIGDPSGSSLVLVDESLPQIFVIIEKLTGKPIIADQNLPNVKINLNIPESLSNDGIINALENVLSMNGVTLIDRSDGFLRAVSTRSVVNQAPEMIEGSTLSMKVSEKIYAKLFTPRYIPVSELSSLIRQILSQNISTVIPFEESNSLLVTDRLSNLQRLESLLNLVDQPRSSKIESKIFRIKHGDAKNISTVLNKLISGQMEDPTNNRPRRDEPMLLARPAVPQLSIQSDPQTTEFKLSRDVSIECDEYSNSVIICGNVQDIKQIEKIINELDILLDQVRIEVVIAQVTLSNHQTSGLESLGIGYNGVLNAQGNFQTTGDNRVNFSGAGASNNRVGSAFKVNGTLNNFSLSYVFNKARANDKVAVLSAPTIVTTHNREASVKVGESRPVITANFTDVQNQKSIRNSVNYKDIGIELVVTPLIGQNGIIQMKIDQRIQKINGEVEVDGNKQPIISNRQAVSFVSVQDGGVVVLAGLQEKETIRSKGRLWLLGYIPVIGDLLFSPKTQFEQTNELIIFIRPTIITNPSSTDEYYQKFVNDPEIRDDILSYERDKKFLSRPDDDQKKQQTKRNKRRTRMR